MAIATELLDPDTPPELEELVVDAKTISERLKKLRLARELTQQELAEKLDTSQQNVARWEGGTEIPAGMVPEIAKALRVPIAMLFPRESRRRPKKQE